MVGVGTWEEGSKTVTLLSSVVIVEVVVRGKEGRPAVERAYLETDRPDRQQCYV